MSVKNMIYTRKGNTLRFPFLKDDRTEAVHSVQNFLKTGRIKYKKMLYRKPSKVLDIQEMTGRTLPEVVVKLRD